MDKILEHVTSGQIPVDYHDDDIIIVDNAKKLTTPDVARVDMNFLVVCSGGKAQFDLNGTATMLEKNQLLMAPTGTVLSNFMISPDFNFMVLIMTNRILMSFLREKMSIWNELVYVYKEHVIVLHDNDIEYFSHFYTLLRMSYETHVDMPFRTEVIQSVLRCGLLGLCGRLKLLYGETPPERGLLGHPLFQRFVTQLSTRAVKHVPVEVFARELCVSAKYLSAVCKRSSGKSASQWITEHVMEDIRYYLAETDLTVKEVSNTLGFANASFFGKYVREHFGLTPLQLRQRLRSH